MRVTSQMRTDQAIREIQSNLGRLSDLQSQIATGQRFTRAEQDPLGTAQVLTAQRGQRAIDQYTKNATAAQVRLGAEQAVVQNSDDLLRQARNLALSFGAGDPPFTAAQANQRQVATDQINDLLNQMVSLGNTKIGDEYILAGDKSTTPPFDPAAATIGTYQGGTMPRRTEIAQGVAINVNHTGDQYVAPAIAALKALRDAVDPANNQTQAQVQTAVDNVFTASENLQVSLAQTGSTGSQIVNLQKSNATLKNDLETVRSNAQDAPPEEAIAKLLSLQTTVQASYSATSRLLSLNLSDYLA